MKGFATSDYQYDLPKELIAQDPLADRASSRLMVLDRTSGAVSHHTFSEIASFLKAGDLLVLNDTKVLPVRLYGVKEDTGAKVEVLLLKRVEEQEASAAASTALMQSCSWECIVRPGKKLRPGAKIVVGDGQLKAEITGARPDGNRIVRFTWGGGKPCETKSANGGITPDDRGNGTTSGDCADTGKRHVSFEEMLDALGEMPLPPYITHKLQDRTRDNTVYAMHDGSAAAPTAGLHFTQELLDEVRAKGIRIAYVTLHVGLGTFRPVKTDDVREHHMHREWYSVPEETARLVNETKAAGGRVICVGTTSCRTLESAALRQAQRPARPEQAAIPALVEGCAGETDIFIYPGYDFKVMDGLITNFHLPESTLLMLVSAFADREHVLAAYREAVRERYRFFSFGDAMLIL